MPSVRPDFAAVEEEGFLPSNFCALFNFLFDRGTRPHLSPTQPGHNWTADEFARVCRVEPRTVNNWRSGRTLPFRDALIDIEEAFFGDLKDADPYKHWRLRLRHAHAAANKAKKATGHDRSGSEPVIANTSNRSPNSSVSNTRRGSDTAGRTFEFATIFSASAASCCREAQPAQSNDRQLAAEHSRDGRASK